MYVHARAGVAQQLLLLSPPPPPMYATVDAARAPEKSMETTPYTILYSTRSRRGAGGVEEACGPADEEYG